jgi:hypothetical protein
MKQFSFNDIDDIKWDIEIHYPAIKDNEIANLNNETIIFKSDSFNITCTNYMIPLGTLFGVIPTITKRDGSKEYGSIIYAGDFLVSLDPDN